MSRTQARGMFGLVFCGFALSAQADDLPPLIPPGETPVPAQAPVPALPAPAPSSTPPLTPPASARRPEPAADENRPVLAIPGLNAPGSRTPRSAPRSVLPPSSLSPDQTDALPPLVSPIDRPTTRSEPITAQPLPSRRFSPGIVETVPRPRPTVDQEEVAPRRTSPMPSREVSPAREFNESKRDSTSAAKAYDEATGYRSRMLNRLMPTRPGGRPMEDESSISAEPRTDPAADAALKRRIERQLAETVGKKIKRAEVRVVGRMITIQVSGVGFFQKRGVRKSIETMPILTGYKAVIDVRD